MTYTNQAEVDAVLFYLKKFRRERARSSATAETEPSIGIITPYKGQKELLQSHFVGEKYTGSLDAMRGRRK